MGGFGRARIIGSATNDKNASLGGPVQTLEAAFRYSHPTFHKDAGATAHHRLGDGPLTAGLGGLSADAKGAGGMTEANGLTLAAAGS